MSYSKAQLQAMFDDMTMLVSEVIPSFQAKAAELISLGLTNLEESTDFKTFELNYGKEAGEFLLKMVNKFKGRHVGIKKADIEAFCAEEVLHIGAHEVSHIVAHWIGTRPLVFELLLQKYPEVLPLLVNIQNFELDSSGRLEEAAQKEFNEIGDRANEYRPSYKLLAEYCGHRANITSEQKNQFCQSANWLVSTVLFAAETLKINNQLNKYRTADRIDLDSTAVKKAQAERQQKIEEGAEKALEFLIQIKRTEIEESRVNGNSTPDEIADDNNNVLKLSILQGKNTLEKIVAGKEDKQKQEIAIIIGHNPRKMSAAQKLTAADNVEELIAKQEKNLVNNAIAWLQARMKKLTSTLERKPNKTKALQEYPPVSEGCVLIEGDNPLFLRSPNPGANREAQFSQISEVEGNGAKKKSRLELFQLHVEKHKDILADKAISALVTFIEAIADFPRLNVNIEGVTNLSDIGTKQKPRSQSSPNINNNVPQQLDPANLRKKSQSQPNLLDPKLSEASKAGTLFQRKLIRENASKEVTLRMTPRMVPRLLRIPGTRST